ncbi:MAG: TrmH family RNA methyltransferase [Draconibacterium sp.]
MNTDAVTFFNANKIEPFPEDVKLILAVWEIINPGNIGQIIRLAHNVGAQKVIFINEKRNFRDAKIKKTAGFSFEQMDWSFYTKEEFLNLLQSEFQLVALETCTGAESIFKRKLPPKAIILAGSESHGLPNEIVAMSNLQLFIPMPGGCKSMNVSHALSVASFEWYRQNSLLNEF